MATKPAPPKPSPSPAPPPAPPDDPETEAPAAEAEPPVYQTIADEQRARSAEIQAMGPAAYMAKFDARTEEQKEQKPVTGVGTTGKADDIEGWSGSTRSTPEARSYQKK
jgi:hypothetical protein